jgi:putative oxidoreductase
MALSLLITVFLQLSYNFDYIVMWFGNDDWDLGLPMQWLMAFLATATEIVGGFALLF